MIKAGFIGTGNMASAIIKGLKNSKLKFNITGFDKDKRILEKVKKEYKIKIKNSNNGVVNSSDIIILAVKPQNINEVLSEIKNGLTDKHLIISIAAGITINHIIRQTGKNIPIVRVMPNTPALIGQGACAYCKNKFVTKKHENLTKKILTSFCKIVFNLPENKINAITALSGSGPAYFFYFLEAMLDASSSLKIDKNLALLLLSQTMVGAGKMILEGKGTPEELRKKVTSKGGTTEKAINFFEKNKIRVIIKKAILSAKKRADELSKGV